MKGMMQMNGKLWGDAYVNRKQKQIWMALSLSLFTSCSLVAEAAPEDVSGTGQTETMEEHVLDDTVVTATRTPVKAFKANSNINGSSGTYGKMPMAELSNMTSIERIEVLKSSASTLYGADAAGGVINIITRDPSKEKTRTTLSALRGSFGKEQYNFSHYGSKDGFYWDISLQKKKTDNYKDGWGREIVDQLHSTNNTYKIGKRFGDMADVNIVYQTYTSDYLRPTGGWSDLIKDKRWGQYNTGRKDNNKLNINYRQKFGDHAENQLSVFRYQHRQDELAWQRKHTSSAYTAPAIYHYSTIGLSDQFNFRLGEHGSV